MAGGLASLTVAKVKAPIATHSKSDALSRPADIDEEKETNNICKLQGFIKPVRKQLEKKRRGKDITKSSTPKTSVKGG